MPRLLLLALTLALPLSACDTDGVDATAPDDLVVDDTERIDLGTLSQDAKTVVGAWEWEQSTYYETASGKPEKVTASASGRTETWMFLSDGLARQYVDGELVYESGYRVRMREYPGGTKDERPSIQFGDGSYGFDFGTDDGRLVLDDTAVDGAQAIYRRK